MHRLSLYLEKWRRSRNHKMNVLTEWMVNSSIYKQSVERGLVPRDISPIVDQMLADPNGGRQVSSVPSVDLGGSNERRSLLLDRVPQTVVRISEDDQIPTLVRSALTLRDKSV